MRSNRSWWRISSAPPDKPASRATAPSVVTAETTDGAIDERVQSLAEVTGGVKLPFLVGVEQGAIMAVAFLSDDEIERFRPQVEVLDLGPREICSKTASTVLPDLPRGRLNDQRA